MPDGPPKSRLLSLAGFAVVGILTIVFIWTNRADLPAAVQALHACRPLPLALAALTSLAFLLNLGAYHHAAQRALGLHLPLRRALRLGVAAQFVNMVSKSSGMGGLAIFLQEAGRRGQPRGRVIAAYGVTALLAQGAFTLVLAAGAVVVWHDGHLTGPERIALGVFAGYTLVYALVFLTGLRSRRALQLLYAFPDRMRVRALTWLGRPATPADHRQGADDLHEAIHALVRRPWVMLVPALFALLADLIPIAMLWAVLAAFGVDAGLSLALVGYVVSALFSIVGILPAGIGAAEISLGAVFVSYGLSGPTAAMAVVAFRLFEVWLPFTAGAWAAQGLVCGRRGR